MGTGNARQGKQQLQKKNCILSECVPDWRKRRSLYLAPHVKPPPPQLNTLFAKAGSHTPQQKKASSIAKHRSTRFCFHILELCALWLINQTTYGATPLSILTTIRCPLLLDIFFWHFFSQKKFLSFLYFTRFYFFSRFNRVFCVLFLITLSKK